MDDQRTDREGGGVRFRKLRIAWSVMWGVVAVLVCVLWVLSYSWHHSICIRTINKGFLQGVSFNGKLVLSVGEYGGLISWWYVGSSYLPGAAGDDVRNGLDNNQGPLYTGAGFRFVQHGY